MSRVSRVSRDQHVSRDKHIYEPAHPLRDVVQASKLLLIYALIHYIGPVATYTRSGKQICSKSIVLRPLMID